MSSVVRLEPERTSSGPPLVLHWKEPDNPLPYRSVRAPARRAVKLPGLEAPPWLDTGTIGEPFDFGSQVRRLCADIAEHCEELAHIDVSRILFGMTQARNGRGHGLQARVTPLRLRDGRLLGQRGNVFYQVQRYYVDEREMLYLVTFCLPRFLNQDFDDKFITLFHELYHISPQFDGDLRRHPGRCAFHSHSKRDYDEHMADLARAYITGGADRKLHDFLRLDFSQLQQRHGSVMAATVPRPKLVPVAVRRSPSRAVPRVPSSLEEASRV
jgi:hypothetical protein